MIFRGQSELASSVLVEIASAKVPDDLVYEIRPALMDKVSTSNYEDNSLRNLSLLRQYEIQKAKNV